MAKEQKLKREEHQREKTKISEELKKMEYEEMLPVEKKLVLWSIAIGIILLGILIWVSYTFFLPE
jgi:cell division protein FtsL